MRTKLPLVLLRDYVTNKVFKESPSSDATFPQHTSCTPFLIAHYINCDNFSQPYQEFLVAVITKDEPWSFKESMKNYRCKQAMQEDIKVLEDNVTLNLKHLPTGKRELGNQ